MPGTISYRDIVKKEVSQFASLLHAYQECSEEIQQIVDNMAAIIADTNSSPEEIEHANDALIEALFPSFCVDAMTYYEGLRHSEAFNEAGKQLVTKALVVLAPVGTVIYALMSGIAGPYIVLMGLAALFLAAGISAFVRLHKWPLQSPASATATSNSDQPQRTLPAYNRSFQQMVSFSPHVEERPLAVLAELQQDTVEDRTIQVVDIPRDPREMSAFKNKQFRRCTLVGPAMMFPRNCTVINSGLIAGLGCDVDRMWWPVEDGTFRVGGVVADKCVFTDCEFINVGICGTQELIDQFRAELTNRSSI